MLGPSARRNLAIVCLSFSPAVGSTTRGAHRHQRNICSLKTCGWDGYLHALIWFVQSLDPVEGARRDQVDAGDHCAAAARQSSTSSTATDPGCAPRSWT